jgi:RNA polymerase sigma-70 factor (ECF subfamily)
VHAYQGIAFRTAYLVAGDAGDAEDARNRRRSAGRRAALVMRTAADAPSGEAAPSPEAALISSEEQKALLTAVNSLREEDRLVIGCRYFLELSEEETAAALGWRRGTVKSRLSRALERLRAQIEEKAYV